MKRLFVFLSLCSTIFLPALSQIQGNFFQQLTDQSLILSQDGLVRGQEDIEAFTSDFTNEQGAVKSYEKKFSVEVSPTLIYEIGEVETATKSFAVMFLRKKSQSKTEIEFLTIYEQTSSDSQRSAIDQARTKWMELCNAHRAGELVEKMYTANSYYYNRGRLLQGTTAIIEEYSYMNRSSYSLKLTPKHLAFVSSDIAYEIGQCSGSYNNPYMLLWQRQEDGSWQVLMDSNN